MTEEAKKPIYQRWWLWLVVVVAGVGVLYLLVREPAPRLPLRQALVEVVHDELGRTVNIFFPVRLYECRSSHKTCQQSTLTFYVSRTRIIEKMPLSC